jgi:ubiquinone/menaquinone biosynthesis C-methylase UbiE
MLDEEQLQKLLSLLRKVDRASILDVGCGIGRLTELIADELGGRTTGVDFAQDAIDSAKERASHVENLGFRVENINSLSFREAPYDFIIAIDTLYFTKDLKGFLEETLRNLKPNGRILAFYTSKLPQEAADSPENTELGRVLVKMGIAFESWNYSLNEDQVWEKTLLYAEELKEKWIAEGNIDIYKSRIAEAKGNLKAREKRRVVRYLYSVPR